MLDLRGNVVLPCQYDEIDHYTDRFIKINRPRKGGKSRRHRNKQGKRKVRLTSKDLGKPLMDALRAYAALCPLLDYSEVQSISDTLINQLHRELAAEIVISPGQAMPEHTPWQPEEAETQIVWQGDYHHG
ncbi:WG repeat-containing protein [Ruminococcaceae bacterium OttesenSCG-928-I18]|nr:WG repeat-containing protein [Ruminococcaceae bacterium OttesenSCG-928-I18]